jgi:hypothetical protein
MLDTMTILILTLLILTILILTILILTILIALNTSDITLILLITDFNCK